MYVSVTREDFVGDGGVLYSLLLLQAFRKLWQALRPNFLILLAAVHHTQVSNIHVSEVRATRINTMVTHDPFQQAL